MLSDIEAGGVFHSRNFFSVCKSVVQCKITSTQLRILSLKLKTAGSAADPFVDKDFNQLPAGLNTHRIQENWKRQRR